MILDYYDQTDFSSSHKIYFFLYLSWILFKFLFLLSLIYNLQLCEVRVFLSVMTIEPSSWTSKSGFSFNKLAIFLVFIKAFISYPLLPFNSEFFYFWFLLVEKSVKFFFYCSNINSSCSRLLFSLFTTGDNASCILWFKSYS